MREIRLQEVLGLLNRVYRKYVLHRWVYYRITVCLCLCLCFWAKCAKWQLHAYYGCDMYFFPSLAYELLWLCGCVRLRESWEHLFLSLLSTGNFFCRTHICQFFALFLSLREPQSLWSLLLRASRTIFFFSDFDIQTHWVRKRARLTYVSVSTLKIGKQTCPNVKTSTHNANWLRKNYNF